MANKNQLLPGIVNDDVEFFLDDDMLKVIAAGKVVDFTELSFSNIQILREEIEADKELKMHLLDMHPNSEYKRLEQFVRCRFGGLDYEGDITRNGVQKGEWWDCPLRGHCASEGILCKPVSFNGNQLNDKDISLVQLLATNYTNEHIAETMHLPLGSFHLAKKRLYQKLGVQTKQESTIIAQRLNLI